MLALAGGVGAARFLSGLTRALPARDVTAVVNTGDDRDFYGSHVSPDLDIVTYTLSGQVDPERGYGLRGDSFALIDPSNWIMRIRVSLPPGITITWTTECPYPSLACRQ